jgi:magnesium transporter
VLTSFPQTSTLAHAAWVDLLDATPAETAKVEQALNLKLPTRLSLTETESLRRSRAEQSLYSMTVPLITRDGSRWRLSPTAFLLDGRRLITVRVDPHPAFDALRAELSDPSASSLDLFTALLEEIVDGAADRLEACSGQLDHASLTIFGDDAVARASLSKRTIELRRVMSETGRASELMSMTRYAMVALTRMSQYVSDRCTVDADSRTIERLASVGVDLSALAQFEENLLNRVQLLQDAANAFISIEQNDVVKVLTIASVVGVPPVLVVGLYGMNFKYMPELSWTYGYPYALALMVVSGLVPFVWFKMKGWM